HGGAAVGLGELDPQYAGIGELRQQRSGKLLRLVPLHHVGTYLPLREVADSSTQDLLFLRRPEVHSRSISARRSELGIGSRGWEVAGRSSDAVRIGCRLSVVPDPKISD